jgi:hypothetical protein
MHLTPAEKAKIERAKKLPKDPTEILLDSVVSTPSSYTAWTPSNDAAPPPTAMKAMLASLDDMSFVRLRELHKLHKDTKALTYSDAVKPAVEVLTEAAHSEQSQSLGLLAQKLATLSPERAARFLHALETKLKSRADPEVATPAPQTDRRAVALLEKQKAVAAVESEWSDVDLGWGPVGAEAKAVGESFGSTAEACDAAAKTLSDLRPSLISAHQDARGAIDVNVDMVLRGLSRMQERMATGSEELQAAARLINQAGSEGVKRRNALLVSVRSQLHTAPRAAPHAASPGSDAASDELAAVSFAARLLPAVD